MIYKNGLEEQQTQVEWLKDDLKRGEKNRSIRVRAITPEIFEIVKMIGRLR